MTDGEPEFGWRDFSGPAPEGMMLPSPIMIEAAQRIEELEKMLEKKLDLIKCGIGANYSGDPYENELYTEAAKLLGKG